MRLSRTVSLLVGLLMAVTLSSAFVAPSDAAPAGSHAAKMKPKHDLQADGAEVSKNHFVAYGVITTFPKVYLFRKIGHGKYVLYRKIKTDNRGRFRTRIYQYKSERTCFKVGAPQTSQYAQTVVGVGCIFTVRN
jgi:hypothetical protein